jgi:hypothetical protein
MSASYESVVLRMSTDPEPHNAFISVHPQRPVVKPNADGVKATHSLEMERGMPGIPFQQLELTIRKHADGQG